MFNAQCPLIIDGVFIPPQGISLVEMRREIGGFFQLDQYSEKAIPTDLFLIAFHDRPQRTYYYPGVVLERYGDGEKDHGTGLPARILVFVHEARLNPHAAVKLVQDWRMVMQWERCGAKTLTYAYHLSPLMHAYHAIAYGNGSAIAYEDSASMILGVLPEINQKLCRKLALGTAEWSEIHEAVSHTYNISPQWKQLLTTELFLGEPLRESLAWHDLTDPSSSERRARHWQEALHPIRRTQSQRMERGSLNASVCMSLLHAPDASDTQDALNFLYEWTTTDEFPSKQELIEVILARANDPARTEHYRRLLRQYLEVIRVYLDEDPIYVPLRCRADCDQRVLIRQKREGDDVWEGWPTTNASMEDSSAQPEIYAKEMWELDDECNDPIDKKE